MRGREVISLRVFSNGDAYEMDLLSSIPIEELRPLLFDLIDKLVDDNNENNSLH